MKTSVLPGLLIFIFCIGCKAKYEGKEEGLASKPVTCREFLFPLNGDSATTFGFEATSDVDVVSPRAISIDQNQCYLIDPLYHRVKRISFNDGKIESSKRLPDSLGRINDCIIIGGMLVATSSNGAVIIFNDNLEPIFARKISRGNGSLIGKSSDSFQAYFPSDELKTFRMNMKGEILQVDQGKQDVRNRVHGKPFTIDTDTIHTDTRKYAITSLNYRPNQFGGINLDYVDNGIAFFSIDDSTTLKLRFCAQ